MTPPDLNWDAMLNMTKVEFELISDANKFFFLRKVQEVEFLVYLKIIVKPTTHI